MHLPTGTVSLKDIKFPKLMVGLQGEPGAGKTFSSMTFPNPFVINFDNGLALHAGKDIPVADFTNEKFCDSLAPRVGMCKPEDRPPNARDALTKWLKQNASQFSPQQTLILDSWTAVQDAFTRTTDLVPFLTKDGKTDDFAPWEYRISYSSELMTLLRNAPCHVVVIFHESQVRDKTTGQLLDKLAPLMQGKFVARLKAYFNDYIRCTIIQDAAKRTVYKWQIRSDEKFTAKTTLTKFTDTFVEPDFNKTFAVQYGR